MKKIIFAIIIVVLVFSICNLYIYAASSSFPSGGTQNTKVKTATEKIWGSVINIAQMLSFLAIIMAGLRYMFASSDARAEIKKSMGILVLGAIIVFATSTVVQLVTGIAGDIL